MKEAILVQPLIFLSVVFNNFWTKSETKFYNRNSLHSALLDKAISVMTKLFSFLIFLTISFIDASRRIFNGHVAKEGDVPWHAGLINNTGHIMCGGTIVSSDVVSFFYFLLKHFSSKDISDSYFRWMHQTFPQTSRHICCCWYLQQEPNKKDL